MRHGITEQTTPRLPRVMSANVPDTVRSKKTDELGLIGNAHYVPDASE